MDRAVAFLREAVLAEGRITVVGDRDVDGVSSTALVGSFLQRICQPEKVILRVSSAGDDYGLSGDFYQDLKGSESALFIFLDMGTSNGPEIAELVAGGARAIVLDHHQLGGRVPEGEGVAFVNPMLDAARFEHDGKIATVGLAFKFLAGYALSFTAEWNRFELIMGLSNKGWLFRAGAFMGAFANEDQARQHAALLAEEVEFCVFEAGSPSAGPSRYPFLISSSAPITWEPESVLSGNRAMTSGLAEGSSLLNGASRHLTAKEAPNPHAIGCLMFAAQINERPRLGKFLQEAADIAAVGLLADMVPLLGENRTVVRLGMGLIGPRGQKKTPAGRFSNTLRPGLQALLKRMHVAPDRFSSRDLSWSISPALNAAGRMGRTDLALRLLLEQGADGARQAAAELVALNDERRLRTRRNEAIAAEAVLGTDRRVIFCFHPDLEPGVSGIVAARLVEQFERPAVFVNPDGAHARGSARSYAGENVLELIASAEELLIQFGGHKEAAGFSIAFENIDAFRERILSAADTLFEKPPAQEKSSAHADIEPEWLDFRLLAELESLEPFGAGNPEPILRVGNVAPLAFAPLGRDGRHARFQIPRAPRGIEAIIWGRSEELQEMAAATPIDLYGSLELSHFGGRPRLRFRVDDFRPAADGSANTKVGLQQQALLLGTSGGGRKP